VLLAATGLFDFEVCFSSLECGYLVANTIINNVQSSKHRLAKPVDGLVLQISTFDPPKAAIFASYVCFQFAINFIMVKRFTHIQFIFTSRTNFIRTRKRVVIIKFLGEYVVHVVHIPVNEKHFGK